MKQLRYTIRTLAPVLLSTRSNTTIMTATHSDFSGSIVRGVLATRFVERNGLHSRAHSDQNFIELFYGGLRFLPANPECRGERAIVLPLSLQQAKAGSEDEGKIQDRLIDKESKAGYNSLRGFGVVRGERIKSVSVKKSMAMHMSRSAEDERLAGKSIGGNIYNYESLNEGQSFVGSIVGEPELLERLIDGLTLENNSMKARIGRSRFTQYGGCSITFGSIENLDQLRAEDERKIFLRLDTPLIPRDDLFVNAREVLSKEILSTLEPNVFSIGEIFSAGVEVENFIVPWSMKSPRVMALAAGSVFSLEFDRPLSEAQLERLNDQIHLGVGIRTEEGFGQLRVWKSGAFQKDISTDAQSLEPIELSSETIRLAKKILLARCAEQIRLDAHKAAHKIPAKFLRDMTHFYARLESLLRRAQSHEEVRELLAAELRDNAPFKLNLETVRMSNGQTIFDVLMNDAPLPFEPPRLPGDLVEELGLARLDREFFLDYMRNWFLTARKLAAGEGSDD